MTAASKIGLTARATLILSLGSFGSIDLLRLEHLIFHPRRYATYPAEERERANLIDDY